MLVPTTVALTVQPAKLGVGIALAALAAMLAVIARRVAAGRWTDYDVSDPQQRHGLYPVAIGIVVASAAASWWLGAPASFMREFVAVIGVLLAGAVLTRWTKVSLHMLIGAFCVTVAGGADLRVAMTLAVLVVAMGWSRVALGRHTVGQVLIGAIVGGMGGWILTVVNAHL